MSIELLLCKRLRSQRQITQGLSTFRNCLIRVLEYLTMTGILLIANSIYAQSFFEPSNRPGSIAVVDLGPASDTYTSVQWNGRPVAIITENELTLAVVGIPMSVEPGEQVLSLLDGKGDEKTIGFTVTPQAYAEQRLTITNKRKVNPAPLDMVRITAENKPLKVVKSSRAERLTTDTFI